MPHGQSDRQILDLIGRVYDAALDDALWADLAPAIASAFSASSTTLQLQHRRLGEVRILSLTHNVESAIHQYSSYYWQHDLWVERAAKLGLSKILTSQELAPDDEFERTEYYNDWCRRLDIYRMLGTVFPVTDDYVSIIGIHRPARGRPFDEADRQLAGLFFPHLKRALQIRQRMAEPDVEHVAALDALERSKTAVMVVSPASDVIHATALAEALLRAGDAIRLRGRKLTAAYPAASGQLLQLIQGAAATAANRPGGTSGGALMIERAERLPLSLLVAPFRPAKNALGAPFPAAIIFFRDPEATVPATSHLRELFGLTATETAVAIALVRGEVLQEIARANGVSINTVRTQLRSIFAKTGTNRQTQLITLLLGTVAGMV